VRPVRNASLNSSAYDAIGFSSPSNPAAWLCGGWIMSATSKFRQQHAEILEIAKSIDACLAKLPGAIGDVRAHLTALAGKVNLHLALEDEALYPRLRAHPDAKVQSVAKKFTEEMSGIKAAFQKYIATWSDVAIRGDAAGFVAATKGLFAALGQRIQRENTELYPLLDKAGS
jgi:hemerythrin HHE cation binding domain-containing protein